MMSWHRSSGRRLVAIVATYALVLQAIFSSFALFAHGGPGLAGTFVASICWTDTGASTPTELPSVPTGAEHGACCILCSVPWLDSTRVGSSIAVLTYHVMPAIWISKVFASARATLDRLPGFSRAPPIFA